MIPRSAWIGVWPLVTALPFVYAPATVASGINLFWNDCSIGPSAATHMDFACDTNEGAHVLVASFVAPADLPQFVSFEAVIDLGSDSCPLSDWWRFKNVGSCRQTALAISFTPPPEGSACEAVIPAPCVEGFAYRYPWGSNQARISLVGSLPAESPRTVVAGTEYFAFRVVIQNSNTVGEGACGGCAVPVCITLAGLSLLQLVRPTVQLDVPDVSSVATWQGVPECCGAICDPPPTHDCTTPAPRSTWGRVKSLYR